MKIIVGTYTQGIYQTHLTATGLTPPTLLADTPQPTYLNYSRSGFLFSANQAGKVGGISVFKLTEDQLIPCDDYLSFAPAPVHLNVDDTHHLLFASNYNGGYTDIYNFTTTGQLQRLDSFLNVGQGPRPQQNTSHVHFTCLTPDGRLLVLDLGTDSLFTFTINDRGQLQDLVATFHFRAGFGPRHLRFDPAQHCVYVLGELASTVAVLNYDAVTGTFHQTQLISTIPIDWNGQTGGGAIYLAHNGHYLYVSNRGHNSIMVYRIAGDSTHRHLTAIQNVSSQGDFPRDFCLSPNDDFLIVGNQKTNLLSIFSVDAVTGKLTPSLNSVQVPEPVCVKLIPD
ncbi:lactonase family protein [Levilactobacillus fujinensis]|uniref:Lactonase family protein n=1 Tax=Levilactobacillus fujinensis TaxID=2486024 RepID=A0ABW1TC83_9LACO|nr:lactonase family protein [Levilactobacillus fujinensis]